jgi:deazaflavin-dependent oxidoreductase (nitroreductase family)
MSVELTPGGTRGVQWPRIPGFLMRVGLGLTVLVYRLLGDRMKIMGQPPLLLHTVGAKTGKARQTVLLRFADGAGWLVVASFGGSARHPAWYVNMARNPDQVWVEIGGRRTKVRPESLQGDERDQAFQRIIALAPGYGGYQQKTDRRIPVIRLTPELPDRGRA